MSVFKKRESLVENIAYMAIMSAINVVFVLLTTLVPFLLFLLVFILPLSSSVVTVFCKKKYYPIYALATIGLCMIVTIWNVGDTFYYVIPSIITGFVFGVLIDKRFPTLLLILLATYIQTILTYGTIYIFEAITNRNFLNDLFSIISLSDYPYKSYLKPIIIFAIALIQETFSYIVIKEELPKFGVKESENDKEYIVYPMFVFTMSILTIALALTYPDISYLFLISASLIGVYELMTLISFKNKISWICLGISFVIGSLAFSIFYNSLKDPLGLLLIGVYPLLFSISVLINYYLIIKKSKL